jgi:two-component system, OmpR family, sensor kinase
MSARVRRKWRPPLLLVLGGALAAVLVLPLLGVLALREMQGALGFRNAALLVAAVVGLVTLALGWLLWRLLLLPIKALAEATALIRQGAPAGALEHYGTAELGALGVSVLGMARSLQDREATIRHFSDHVGHELKSPLTAIKGAAELLEGEARLIAVIEGAVAKMEAQLAGLQRMAAAREVLYRGSCDLAEVALGLPAMGVELRAEAGQVPLAAQGLAIVLGHLVQNAAEQGAGCVEMWLEAGVLLVRDDGSGISEGNRAQIFAPFFTSRREAGGTGMGLAIVQGLLLAHGAEICLDPGRKTQFRIVFADA